MKFGVIRLTHLRQISSSLMHYELGASDAKKNK